jgi:hypothetical protein
VPTPSITENRSELKYRLTAGQAVDLVTGVAAHLPEHRYEGKGGNRLPRARHYVTTIYFDTPTRDLYRAASQNEENLKLREREYYDVHPELAELATHAQDLVRYDPVLWIEIKRKSSSRTTKQRVGVPKSQVQAFLQHGEVTREMRGIEQSRSAAQGVIDELLALREQLTQPLAASCLVNYRRTAWQDASAALRVTLDQRLCCFAPPADLWTRQAALVGESLGSAAWTERDYILEVKTKGEPPQWLAQLLAQCQAQASSYSKFVTASRAVHGQPPDARD